MKNIGLVILADRVLDGFLNVLTRRMGEFSLIQRSINLAISMDIDKESVYLLSNDDEALLIAERNNINKIIFDPNLTRTENLIANIASLQQHSHIITLSPLAPMIKSESIIGSLDSLISERKKIVQPVKSDSQKIFDIRNQSRSGDFLDKETESHFIEFNGFSVFETSILEASEQEEFEVLRHEIKQDYLEIQSREDWWVFEKILNRKRIVIRIIGDDHSGMGHVYRSVTLANEIIDHEIIFVCTDDNKIAIDYLEKTNYLVKSFSQNHIEDGIMKLNPNMVINDILDTRSSYIKRLKASGCIVINFEDFGSGSTITDLTINELFDDPQNDSPNTLWGRNYYFLRDEFNDAKPNEFRNTLAVLLLTFGGTDPNNLSLPILKSISNLCKDRNITIKLVVGPGFQRIHEIDSFLKSNETSHIEFINATGVISSIMEETDFAITSNGRTLYELAHMNIPAIVVAQNKQETTHKFSVLSNGFVNIGEFDTKTTPKLVLENLEAAINSIDFRRILFQRTQDFDFSMNKSRVLKKILSFLEKDLS